MAEFKPRKAELLIQPGKTSISTKRLAAFLKANTNVSLKAFESKNEHGRYLHAKILIANSESEEHVLTGSANISDVAFLGNSKAFNHEACVYERNEPKKAFLRGWA